MYYRRKLILALIEIFGGTLSGTDLQKLLFLLSDKLTKRYYDFVPYKYGCFSFQSITDKNSLIKSGHLHEDTKSWVLKLDKTDYAGQLTIDDRKTLIRLKTKFKDIRGVDLIRYVYTNYPYFAINSQIAGKYLTEAELQVIDSTRPLQTQAKLFTIGYEGLSVDSYFNQLITNNIKVLCDVRKNAYSMKYGFSKKQLSETCSRLNILYIHIPELGIVSDKRQALVSQLDYDVLFDEYEKTTLQESEMYIIQIQDIVSKHKRVALTCFERDYRQCHRSRVAKAISQQPEWEHETKHL